MTPTVQRLLDEIDHLPESERKALASEVLRRFLDLDAAPLTDDELVQIAEDRFLALDREELERRIGPSGARSGSSTWGSWPR